ncbi:MAG: erythromycin esterase family protein [Bacteroidetes bacterium]|nr:erythromycin esterase family protein [Bacteroidota bacterium]
MKRTEIIIALLLCTGIVSAQKAPDGVEINIRNTDEFEGFSALDSAVRSARVVMTGENHTYVNFNSRMEMKMLRYLYHTSGVRNFVIELGSARAGFLNRYLNRTDTLAELCLKATTSPRYMDFFKRLRKWNEGLPDSARIRVWGIDVERFNDLPLLRLNETMGNAIPPAEIRNGVEAVRTAAAWILQTGLQDYREAKGNQTARGNRTQRFTANESVLAFLDYFDSLQPAFRSWLGAEYQKTEQAVNWLREYRQWKAYDNKTFQYIWREEGIYSKLTALLDSMPAEKFYGQFGRCHTAYEEQNGDCGWYGYHSIVNKLQDRYFKNKTSAVSIGIFYNGYADNNLYSDKQSNEKVGEEVDALMNKTKPRTVMLFNLRAREAELPVIEAKFSYAIVNNRYTVEESDSLAMDSIAEPKPETYKSAVMVQAGYLWSTVSLKRFNAHLAQNGHTSGVAGYTFQSFSMSGYDNGSAWGLHFTRTGYLKAAETGTGSISVSAQQFLLESGFALFARKRFNWLAGIAYGPGQQQLRFKATQQNFLNYDPASVKVFVNPAFLLGAYTQGQLRVAGPLALGFYGSWCRDISSDNRFYYRGTRIEYGDGMVSNPLTGFQYGVRLSAIFPLD